MVGVGRRDERKDEGKRGESRSRLCRSPELARVKVNSSSVIDWD